MSKLRVLVVGASIAGPSAAYWFARAGASVTVIESAPDLRTNGQNIDIRTAGVTVMRKMPGMEEAVRANKFPIEGISFVREDGRPYGIIRPTGDPNQQSLVSEYEIPRGALAKILYDMSKDKDGVRYVFGETISSIQHQSEKGNQTITVEFANGHPTQKFDLVIACDGAHSKTRAMAFGGKVRDYIHPVNLWAGLFTVNKDLGADSKFGQAHSAPGGRFIALGRLEPDSSGVCGTQVSLMSIHPRDDLEATRPFREAYKLGDDPLKEAFRERFKGVGWKCPEAIAGMMEATDFYANENVQVKAPSMFKGRIALVGDAGYAPGPTGGGTTLAMAGAYLLAGEITKHGDDLAAGLKAYEERMKPIVKDLQQIPFLVPGVMAPQTAWGTWLRNNIFAFICWTGVVDFTQKYFSNGFAHSDKYNLLDYDWVV